MTLEEQTKALEDEAAAVNKEIRQALLDIRALLMDITTPLKDTSEKDTTEPGKASISDSSGKEGNPDGNGPGKAG